METTTVTPRRDAWLWRLSATGVAFIAFGIGSLLLGLLIFPALALWPADATQRRRRARRLIHKAFRLLIRSLQGLRVIELQTHGVDRLGRAGQLIVANHPSLLDVVLLIGHLPDTNCIVKHSLAKNPYIRGPLAHACYIRNRDVADMIDSASAALREGQTLIVFPEGTRTPAGQTLAGLHRGAAAIALRGARTVTPVTVRMQPRSLGKNEPWYRIPAHRIYYILEVGADIDPQAYAAREPMPAATCRLTDFLAHYFSMELCQDGKPEKRTETAHHRLPGSGRHHS